MGSGLLPTQLSPPLQRLLAVACCLLLLLLLGAQIHSFTTSGPEQVSSNRATESSRSTQTDLRRPPDLAQYQLFGQRSETPVVLPSSSASHRDSGELRLKGTLAGNEPNSGIALIATADAGEQVFTVGSEMPGNRILREVHANHVVIERNSQLSILELPREGSSRQASRANRPSNRQASNRQQQRSSSVLDSGALRVAAPSAPVSIGSLDPEQIAQQVRPMAVHEDGRMIGFRLQAGRDSQFLQQVGLRSNDVIVAVDGVEMTDLGAGFRAVQQLQGSDRATVRIRRDGREQTITVDRSQIDR